MTPTASYLASLTIAVLLALWRWEVWRRRGVEAANARLLGKYLKAVLLAKRWRNSFEDVRAGEAAWDEFRARVQAGARRE